MKRAASQPTCSYNLRDKSVKPQKYKQKPSQQSVLETPRVTDRLPTRRPLDQTMADTFRGEDTFADTTTRPQGEVIRGNHSGNQTIVVLSPQTQKDVDEGHMSLYEAAEAILSQDTMREVVSPPIKPVNMPMGSAGGLGGYGLESTENSAVLPSAVLPSSSRAEPIGTAPGYGNNELESSEESSEDSEEQEPPEPPEPPETDSNTQIKGNPKPMESWGDLIKRSLWMFCMNLALFCACLTCVGGWSAWVFIFQHFWVFSYSIYVGSFIILSWFIWFTGIFIYNLVVPFTPNKYKPETPSTVKLSNKETKSSRASKKVANAQESAGLRVPVDRNVFTQEGGEQRRGICTDPNSQEPTNLVYRAELPKLNSNPGFQSSTKFNRVPSFYPRRLDESPSGGWNDIDFATSTPGPVQSSLPKPQKFNNPSSLKSDSRHRVTFGDQRDSFYQYQYNTPGELSVHDQDVINDRFGSQMSFSHTPIIPEFSGKPDQYSVFRRDFLAILPTIPTRVRLATLRNSLVSSQAKRVIEDFETTDPETFCNALKALDREYNNTEENVRYILEEVRKLTQTHSKSDDDFVDKLADMTSYLKRLVKIQEGAHVFLEPLAYPWMDYVPEPIFRKAQRLIGCNKSWLNFNNLFNLAEEFACSVKRTKAITASRLRVQRANVRGSQHSTYRVEASEVLETSSFVDEDDPLEVNYVKGRSKPIDCCFCQDRGDGHHSTTCTSSLRAKERQDIIFKQGRCFLCLETGHRAFSCPLLKMKIPLNFKCEECPNKSPHARIVCEHVSPKLEK